MILKRFLTIALVFWGAVAAAAPRAPSADEALLKAYEAFRAGDPIRLARQAPAVQGHVLEPYFEYWQLALRLEEAATPDLRAYLQRHAGSYLAERLRADWLKELGKRAEWHAFDVELPLLVQDDLEVRCYAWSSRLVRGDAGAYDEAEAIWLEPRELPEGCTALTEKMIAEGRLGTADIWQRARVLLEHGRLTAAKGVLGYLPPKEAPDERMLAQAAGNPERFLARAPRALEQRPVLEMVRFALVRLARSDPRAAAELLGGALGARLPQAERQPVWGWIGYEAARRHLPEAVQWFRLAGDAALGDEQLAWKARAALREGDWQLVREAIDPMSFTLRRDPAWGYWYGRALAAQGNTSGARAYFLRISGQPNFYGALASEELGEAVAVPKPFHVPTEDEVARAARTPGLVRALALYRLGLRPEATREWIFSVRGLDDRQLLAAAEVARREEVFDRAINTADRTSYFHNYQVRFLAPFREVFRDQARAFDLEEAWVLGIVRQESRFIVDAKSSAGARGLMQLMPATARWVARKNGIRYSPQRVLEVETNVTLGTRYLKYVLEELGHPVLASAAYNAGPGRARRWRDAKPLEGAIYAETIPFNETRDYVKKVMANTMYYAALLGGATPSLKERLGTIAAKSSDERVNEKLP